LQGGDLRRRLFLVGGQNDRSAIGPASKFSRNALGTAKLRRAV
jgi:hypothetical protein